MNENKRIGQKIKKARLAIGITQNQLGKKIGKTGSAVGYLEAGLRKISPDVLKKIADALNKPFKYFYEDSEEEYNLHSKIISFEKQMRDLAQIIGQIEKEKFYHKEFYESIINEIPKIIIFLDAENGTSFINKKGKEFFKLNKKQVKNINVENIITDFSKIFDQHEKAIKTNISFQFTTNINKKNTKKLNFTAKSVYDKSGRYLGMWLLEK